MSSLSPAAAPEAGADRRPPDLGRDRLLPLGAAVSQLVTFGVVLLLARILKPQGVGLYIQAYAVLALLSSLCLAGLRGGLSSAVAGRRSAGDEAGLRGTIALGLALPTAAAILCAGLLFAAAPSLLRALSMDPRLSDLLRLAAVTLVFHVFTDCALAATRGFHTTRYFALVSLIVEPVLRLVVTADLLGVGAGIRGALVALLASNVVAAILAGITLWRLLDPVAVRPRYDLRELHVAPVSWLGALATTGLIWGDVLLVGALRNSSDAGVYAVATRLVALAAVGLPPVLAAGTPALVRAVGGRRIADIQHRYATTTGWMARLALPGLVALIVLPRDLLALFGPGFAAAATAMVVLATGKLLDALTGPTALMLTLTGRAPVNVLDNGAVLLLNIGLNLYLIPRHGILGAGIAWAASIWVLNIARIVQVWLLTGILPFSLGVLRALVAGNAALLAGLLVSHFLSAPWRLPVAVLLLLQAYIAVTAELGLSREESQGWRGLRQQATHLFAR
ncbi:MAG: oligosaccharide flippase family protein [Frankiaceae bacterium]